MEQEMAAARAQPENDEDFAGVTASYVRALVQGQECERTQQRGGPSERGQDWKLPKPRHLLVLNRE